MVLELTRIAGHDDLQFVGCILAVPDLDRSGPHTFGLDQQVVGRAGHETNYGRIVHVRPDNRIGECEHPR